MELPPSNFLRQHTNERLPDQSLQSLIYKPASYLDVLPLPDLFGADQPLEVELGSGDGSFLAAYAAAMPQINFLGVERLLGRLRKLERKGLRAGLRNLRLLRIEACYCVQYLLPPNSVQAFHIYFPDPWPKRKHRARRLINHSFLEALRRTLLEGGTVYLRTDDPDYFAQISHLFADAPDFQPADPQAGLLAFLTDFETAFQREGVPILRQAFRRG